jgi:murein DD-endopeptidase MepM/ murein hydrolase activator NlpD
MNYRLWIASFATIAMLTLVSTSGGTSVAFADSAEGKRVIIDVDQSTPSTIRFLVTTYQLQEGTVSFKLDEQENLTSTPPAPLEFMILKPYSKFEFLRLAQTAPGSFHFKWSFHYKIGVPTAFPHANEYVYALPYASSEHYPVTQSYFGSYSHNKGSDNEYAVDFAMPEGTTVRAARAGQVIEYRDDSSVGGNSKSFENEANDVVISHGDGTYANYIHLKQHGVLVKLGQRVACGTPIGLSGNTGWSSQPHLHFGIFRVNSGTSITSLPFKMCTDSGVWEKLIEGQTY